MKLENNKIDEDFRGGENQLKLFIIHYLFYFLSKKLTSLDDMILISGIEIVPVSAPAPYSYDEVGVVFGVLARVEQAVAIYRIELELMSAKVDVRLYERGGLLNADVVAENRVVNFKCERSAVDDLGKIVFCEGEYAGERAVYPSVKRWWKA